MKKLTNSYNGEIHLSVDKDNVKAIKLYELFDFKKIDKNEKIFFMRR